MNELNPIPLAFCITELDPGGAERAFTRLILGLDRNRWSPRVYCLAKEGVLARPLRDAGIPVTCFGLTSRRFLRGFLDLNRELRQQRPVILQTFLFHANLLGRIAAIGTSVKHVVGGIRVAERRSPWYLRLDRWTENLVSRHVCVSESVAGFSRESGLTPEKIIVVPNGIDVSCFDQTSPADLSGFGIPPGSLTIITAGRLDPQKGLDLLLDAFSSFRNDHPQSHLIIAGDGTQRPDLELRIRQLSLASQVHLVGHRDDLPSLLKASDLFVLASRWEGMPNVILEAAAARIPIVATDVEGVAEILGGKTSEHGFRFGWRAEPGDAKSLCTALQSAANSGQIARNLAEKARNFVQNEYSWDRMIQSYHQLYESLLASSETTSKKPL